MRSLLIIARREIASRFGNPVVLLLTIGVPLLIAALISVVFGDLVVGRTISEKRIPVGIVNLDRGGPWGNLGELFVQAMLPREGETGLLSDPLFELFTVTELDGEALARRLVKQEKLVATLIIPPEFSDSLAADERATLTVLVDGRQESSGVAFRTVVATLANMLSTGEVTLRTTAQALLRYPRPRRQLESGALLDDLTALALDAARPGANPIQVQRVEHGGQAVRIAWRRYLAAAIAVMFSGFMALTGSGSIFREKAQWTLQRLFTTPNPPGVILTGKTVGTYLGGLLHLGVLVGGMAVLERVLTRGGNPTQRVDPVGLALLVLAGLLAATGLGVAIAGLARTYTQATSWGGLALLLMGLLGGIFFPVELLPIPLRALSRATYFYWAMDGYLRLSRGEGAEAIWLHLAILATMGGLLFLVGSRRLRQRDGSF